MAVAERDILDNPGKYNIDEIAKDVNVTIYRSTVADVLNKK